ncbi:HIT domain-containing protein [Brevibacterium sp. 50QC2O2]|jgi:ATP adenylyltransferase|uniref:HIT family protein n=1 Tax=Brevibacterium TaxID=1696 RepID=UPI00211D07B1|nr:MULTISPECIES: HIT domain-containing protein [unclassified Brevibacterium]MCQ9366919.1 HIT domain-containing protein [Brevibacterium sp. 91QC2O2]MCQ9384069.1 HIT domain-containing protein [Brevibacterium sp. 68QC2CO]MCQ9389077.1 HIT domain-containing protein [Brevibacterium sp. 50QC2O2]
MTVRDGAGNVMPEPEAAAGFPGEPDGLQRLWTPHRMVYIGGQDKPKDATEHQCPFCAGPAHSDEESLIVARGETVFAILNLYPYNPGHLLICPYRHVADYPDLTEAETLELAHFTQHAMRMIRHVSGPDGFNIGINQGEAGGAGIAAHLHQHLVPRWSGDANFLPIVAHTKALPQVHGQVRELYSSAWKEVA